VDELVRKGISRDRITSASKGSRVQPFADNVKNRVSICIAE
ncbi:MAG: OmpA family protein, partial [Bacteroidales bacterium]|nr:OmpA family protein [Bacteroidales bacterium]